MRKYASAALAVFLLAEITQLLCMCASSTMPCIQKEREALLKFKATLHDPLNRLSSWNGRDCCQWEGFGCDNVTAHVVMLDLANPYVKCKRSHQIGHYIHRWEEEVECEDFLGQLVAAPNVNPCLMQLEYLTYLDLSGNYFQFSPIPMFIGSMSRLRYLSLSLAGFAGRIPNSLGNLTNLQFLDLSYNYGLQVVQTNGIKWIYELQSLEHLDMRSVFDLGKALNLLQVLNMLPSLTHIYLANCGLGESLVPLVNLTSRPPKLQVFDLGGNQLPGSIIGAFQNMTSLVHLDFSYNNLVSVPSWFQSLDKLVHLDLSRTLLHDPIPNVFRNMTSIEILYLSVNNFTSIPSWLGELKTLVHLDLSFNVLHGPIPIVFRNMTSIELLALSGNNFTLIPSWFGELKTLVHLDLSWNGLVLMECPLPSIIRNMCHLKSLDFSENKIHGGLGLYELSGCMRYDLESLYLSHNRFIGRLPTWLGQLQNLEYLNLESNLINGSIPFPLGKLSKLRLLRLNRNELEGVLPDSIGLLVNLTYLDLSNNKFTGTIPQSLNQLVKLEALDLSSNKLDGTIPMGKEWSSVMPKMQLWHLNLSNNQITGPVPKKIGHVMPRLSGLFLQSNLINGSIPSSLCQLTSLLSLDLSKNKLSSAIPNCWRDHQHLNFSNNRMNGSFPNDVDYAMFPLEDLFLQNNLINGSIPNSLCQLTSLRNLDLSENKLSGKIPNCWTSHLYLEEINLSSNKLSGVFPSSFGNFLSLLWLHLNNNNLQGELPMSLRKFQNLLILDLGENQLSGSIPSWTPNTFPSLQILRLRQNKLSGGIPSQLCQFTSLKILDLSYNRLEGLIPRCIGNLRGMTLNKSSNEAYTKVLTGVLLYNRSQSVANAMPWSPSSRPPSPKWSEEEVKQVMKGREMDYIKILEHVVNMDLSENRLVGYIPEEITRLTGLHGLNLSNNHLKGEIPTMIGDMISLESLDLSYNQLSGAIPSSMSAISSLGYLNLAHNNFSGPVPTDKQLSTLEDPSIYADNPYLCGPFLPNKCPGNDSHQTLGGRGYEEEDGKKDKLEKILFYFVIAVGFATGFWGVIGTLLVKKSWRHAYFRWVEDVADKIYVATVINVAKLKQWMSKVGQQKRIYE